VIPIVPGHFSANEWLTLAVWIAVGLLLAKRSKGIEPRAA